MGNDNMPDGKKLKVKDVLMDPNQQKEFLKIFDAKSIVDSVEFQTFSAALRMLILIILAIFGAFVSYGMKDLSVFKDYSFWMNTIVMLAEQLYAFSVASDYTMVLLKKYHPEYTAANKDLVDAIDLIKQNPDKLERAIKEWNEDDKITMYKDAIEIRITSIENNIRTEKSRKKIRTKKLASMEEQKKVVKTLLDPKYMNENIKYMNIKGYVPLYYRDLVNKEQTASQSKSKNYMYSMKKYKAKTRSKKVFFGIMSSILTGMIAFNLIVAAEEGIGRIITMLALIIVQAFWGFMDAQTAMGTVLLPDTLNKLEAAVYCSSHGNKPVDPLKPVEPPKTPVQPQNAITVPVPDKITPPNQFFGPVANQEVKSTEIHPEELKNVLPIKKDI